MRLRTRRLRQYVDNLRSLLSIPIPPLNTTILVLIYLSIVVFFLGFNSTDLTPRYYDKRLLSMMRGSSQQFMGIPGPQKILKTVGSLWLSQTSNENANPGTSSSCPASEISCQANYHGQDTCCFNYPGGQMLQTQFWDVDPALGPEDAWTIHGLWPDHCNGGFDQFCDSRRKYSNISLILVDAGRGDLLEYMSEYWKDFRGDDSNLWQHEWNKHGTCVSTLEPDCYADYLPQQEVVDYFDKTVEVYKELPTHEFLANAGIIPSQTRTYALADIEAALEQAHGNPVTIRCRGGAINEIWYHFNIAGSLQSGEFVSAGPDGLKSNCPSRGIKYPLKHARHEPTHTTTIGHPEPTAPGIPFTGRGNLIVERLNRKHGCIISYGTWFSSGTCATFRAEKISDDIFTLKSSKGPCAFERDALACGPHVTTASEFTAKDGKLAYSDHTTFYADSPPKGRTQSNVYASQGGGLLRSRSPGLRSRWSSLLLLSLPMCLVEIRSLVGLSMDRDVIELHRNPGIG